MVATVMSTETNASTKARPVIVQNVIIDNKQPPRITIDCNDCNTLTRVYRVEPITQIGAFKCCPVCTSTHVQVYQSVATDHWESLARAYGMSIELVQQVYELWNPQEHQRFGDFVAVLKSEAKAEAENV